MAINYNQFFDFYKKLIAINSISSDTPSEDISNEAFIDLLKDFLEKLDFKTKKILVKSNPQKFNLIASFIPKDYPLSQISRTINDKETLVSAYVGGIAFSGHSDTVPTDKSKWNTDPFNAEVIDNKLYGLGVIDMKGFFAFVCYKLLHLDFSKVTKPIYVLATADEETSMFGAEEMLKYFFDKPDLIVIGEPTSMEPIIMHKGHVVQTITVKGGSGHSSNPDSAPNAIKIMHEIIDALLKLEKTLKTKYVEKLFPISYPTMNLGMISGGDAPNRICEECSLTFDIRPIPGVSSKICTQETYNALDEILSKYPNMITITKPYNPTEPFNGKISQELQDFLEKISRHKPLAVNYATEATYFQNIAPTIVMGAGDISMAHQPNEYLDLNEVEPMMNILEKLINKFAM